MARIDDADAQDLADYKQAAQVEAGIRRELQAENARLRAALDELVSAACDIRPTAPSSKSIDRLYAAIDAAAPLTTPPAAA